MVIQDEILSNLEGIKQQLIRNYDKELMTKTEYTRVLNEINYKISKRQKHLLKGD